MRKSILFQLVAIVIAVSILSFAHPVKEKTVFNMPACYYNNDMNGQNLGAWASYTGAGMAMYGYTNIHYESHCCTDACYATCASICGTPPQLASIENGVEKTLTHRIDITNAKSLGQEAARKVISENGVWKDVTMKGDIITVTYMISN